MAVQPIGQYDPYDDRWVLVNPRSLKPTAEQPAQLSFATFNIWFDKLHIAARHQALLDVLETTNADFIGLQEVTDESLEMILHQPWVRRGSFVSDINGSTYSGYGAILLSKHPVS